MVKKLCTIHDTTNDTTRYNYTDTKTCGEATIIRSQIPNIEWKDKVELHKITHSNDVYGQHANDSTNQYQGPVDHSAEAQAKIQEITQKYGWTSVYGK